MIQDIMPEVFHNEYRPVRVREEDTVFFFQGREILCAEDGKGKLAFPEIKYFRKRWPELCSAENGDMFRFMFRIDDQAFFLCMGEDIDPAQKETESKLQADPVKKGEGIQAVPSQPDAEVQGQADKEPRSDVEAENQHLSDPDDAGRVRYGLKPIRLLRRVQPKDLCFAAMTAWHLYVWYRDNRFCGRCGQAMLHGDKERMLRCPACGNTVYPRINPAVIVGVTDGDRILVTRYAGREYGGNALIAGFCEIGETVEDTVRREVLEEVGLQVKNIRYYKSQPWGFAGDLLMGFYCQVDGSRTVQLDKEELAVAKWVRRDEIGEEALNLSLTADMMMHFKRTGIMFEDRNPDTGLNSCPDADRQSLIRESDRTGAGRLCPDTGCQDRIQGRDRTGAGSAFSDADCQDRIQEGDRIGAGSASRDAAQIVVEETKQGSGHAAGRCTKQDVVRDKKQISGEGSDQGGMNLPQRIRNIWQGHLPGIPDRKGAAAVLIPLVKKDGDYHLLYEQRASGLTHQPGEICFPGGRIEVGETAREAAVRETVEELLVDADQIELLAALDAQMGPSGAPIWPFAAVLHDYRGTCSADEVGRTFTLPLSWLLNYRPGRYRAELVTRPGEDFPYELIPGGRNYPFRRKKHEIIFYETEEAVIWGVTAKITDDFLNHIRL